VVGGEIVCHGEEGAARVLRRVVVEEEGVSVNGYGYLWRQKVDRWGERLMVVSLRYGVEIVLMKGSAGLKGKGLRNVVLSVVGRGWKRGRDLTLMD